MINIHLCNDEKFIDSSIENFNKIFPNQNLFLIKKNIHNQRNFIKSRNEIRIFNFKENEIVDFILQNVESITEINILVHYLDADKAFLISKLNKLIKFKTYWIFYGVDLYKPLYLKGKYQLYDESSLVSKLKFQIKKLSGPIYSKFIYKRKNDDIQNFILNLDYFCFWNKYDYFLLREYYDTKAQFRLFCYNTLFFPEYNFTGRTSKIVCQVNHSGSLSGNHCTILNKLNTPDIKSKLDQLVIPLSYGNKENITKVNEFCNQKFSGCYESRTEFVDQKIYFDLLGKVQVAFFGHRRQEGAGNIKVLLASGAKVFLREDNNLLLYYRDLGIILFSFEKNFKGVQDLQPLDENIQKENHRIIVSEFSEEKIDLMHKNIFK